MGDQWKLLCVGMMCRWCQGSMGDVLVAGRGALTERALAGPPPCCAVRGASWLVYTAVQFLRPPYFLDDMSFWPESL